MMDFRDADGFSWSLLLSIIGGLVISLLTADQQTLPVAMARVVVGFLAAFLFTDAIVHWLELDPGVFQNPVAALLAISGYVVARVISNFRKADILNAIAAWRRK